MAKPRIFISSTFSDLRQVRADLDRFVKELGYDTVRNETGGIPYGKDQKLEDYCYKEISEIDILVGIVGGRFGSEAERGNYSITQVEIKTAIEQNKQVYIFIEKNVLAEYQTYSINKDNESTKYRFVEDKKIYKFIEEIYSLPKNNIVHPFETAQDITFFLREQWAGLFRDLLHQQTKKIREIQFKPKESDKKIIKNLLDRLDVDTFHKDIKDQDSWYGYRKEAISKTIDFAQEAGLISNKTSDEKLNNLLLDLKSAIDDFNSYSSNKLYDNGGDWYSPAKNTDLNVATAEKAQPIMNSKADFAFNKLTLLMDYLKHKNYLE